MTLLAVNNIVIVLQIPCYTVRTNSIAVVLNIIMVYYVSDKLKSHKSYWQQSAYAKTFLSTRSQVMPAM